MKFSASAGDSRQNFEFTTKANAELGNEGAPVEFKALVIHTQSGPGDMEFTVQAQAKVQLPAESAVVGKLLASYKDSLMSTRMVTGLCTKDTIGSRALQIEIESAK